eukprot:g14017.t1
MYPSPQPSPPKKPQPSQIAGRKWYQQPTAESRCPPPNSIPPTNEDFRAPHFSIVGPRRPTEIPNPTASDENVIPTLASDQSNADADTTPSCLHKSGAHMDHAYTAPVGICTRKTFGKTLHRLYALAWSVESTSDLLVEGADGGAPVVEKSRKHFRCGTRGGTKPCWECEGWRAAAENDFAVRPIAARLKLQSLTHRECGDLNMNSRCIFALSASRIQPCW